MQDRIDRMTAATISAVRCRTLRISAKTDWTFIEVEASDGIVGIGEASVNGAGGILRAHAEAFAARIVGCPAMPATAALLAGDIAGGLHQRAVASAIEQALWDGQGHRLGVPVTTLLGGAVRERVPLYANINRRTADRRPEGFAESARLAVAAGHTHVKLAPFDGVGQGDPLGDGARIDAGLDRIRAVCEAMGSGGRVLVDCHWRLDEPSAFRVLDVAAALGLFWLECPVPETPPFHPLIGRLKREASRRGLRLAGLETCLSLAEIRPHVEAGHYDVLMPDVKYIGGLAATRAVADLAGTAGIHVAPHNPTGPVCHAASLASAASLPDCLTLEVQFDETPLFADLVRRPFPVENGTCALLDGPGLGVSLDPALVRSLEVR